MRESRSPQGTMYTAPKTPDDTAEISTAMTIATGSASSFPADEVLRLLSEGGLSTSLHITINGYAWTVRTMKSMVVLA